MKPILNCLLILFCFSTPIYCQNTFRAMFYNVENLFDTIDNPDTEDDEFTPTGKRYWTQKRYYNKINNIAKVISSLGEWDFPALVGLCEIENEKVLNDLTLFSPLRNAGYKYIITESPDIRGINVAFLYQRDQFKYLNHHCIRLPFPKNKEKKTRDILHITGLVITQDTLDIFICHFPSRRGGEQRTESDRMFAAQVLRERTDSLFTVRKNAHILIMGDFNDEPSNKSLTQILRAGPIKDPIVKNALYNTTLEIEKKSKIGSYKYRNEWNFLDQIIVSGNLLDPTGHFYTIQPFTQIYQAEFLFTPDTTHGGKRLKKTYHGYKYEGGYSDHLPVYIDFIIHTNKSSAD